MPVSATLSYNLDGPFMPASHMLDTTDLTIAHIVAYAAANPDTVHTFIHAHVARPGMPALISAAPTALADRFLFIAYCGDQSDYAHVTQIDMRATNPNPL